MKIENGEEVENNASGGHKSNGASSERTHHYGQKDDEESPTVYFSSPGAQKEAGNYTQPQGFPNIVN